MIGHHSRLRDVMGQSYLICARTRTNGSLYSYYIEVPGFYIGFLTITIFLVYCVIIYFLSYLFVWLMENKIEIEIITRVIHRSTLHFAVARNIVYKSNTWEKT